MHKAFVSIGFLGSLVVSALSTAALGACQSSHEDSSGASEAATARPARAGLDKAGGMHVSPGDRCPVCAMEVAEHTQFASAIELRDGRTYYFCGTGCMIRSWLHPEVFLGSARDELGRAVVKEYFAGEHVDASKVIFVAGSDIVGPMGKALVPLKNEADLETFMKRHKGKTTFRLAEMDDARWEKITGKRALGSKQQ